MVRSALEFVVALTQMKKIEAGKKQSKEKKGNMAGWSMKMLEDMVCGQECLEDTQGMRQWRNISQECLK